MSQGRPPTPGAGSSVAAALRRYQRAYLRVPGWFSWIDYRLFTHLLVTQEASAIHGDLLEIGAYQGRSAILIGLHARPGETLSVVDTFDSEKVSDANFAENRGSYGGLRRAQFEANYRRYGLETPRVFQEDSTGIMGRLPPGTQRFIHVDGSHLYDVVRKDIENATRLSSPEGVIVCDDYRSAHTPGVAAAVWIAAYEGRLHLLAASPQKVYMCRTREEVARYQKQLIERLNEDGALEHASQSLLGAELLLVDGLRRQRQQRALQERLPGAFGAVMSRFTRVT